MFVRRLVLVLVVALAMLGGSAVAAARHADHHLVTFHGSVTSSAQSHHWLQIHTSGNKVIRFQTRLRHRVGRLRLERVASRPRRHDPRLQEQRLLDRDHDQ